MNSFRDWMLGLALALVTAPSSLSGADLSAGLKELFDSGAKNTPPAVAAAREHYESLKRANLTDARIDYAYGLVLINQHKYADALPLVARYVAAAGDDLSARQVEIHALVQDRKVPQALDAAAALAARFPEKPPAGDPPAGGVQMAEFLGTILGYLELIRPSAADGKAISERKNQIVARLGKAYLPALDRGRETIATRLAELQAELDTKQQKILDAAEQRQEKAKAIIDKDREKVAAEKETIQASTEHLRDAGRELGVIQQQLSTLNQDRTRLSTQIVTAQAQLAGLQNTTSTTNTSPIVDNRPGSAPRPGDIFVESRVSITRLEIPLDRYFQAYAISVSLARLNKQAFDLDRDILNRKIRAAELMGDGKKAAALLEESAELSAKAEKRAAALERQLNRLKTASARSTRPPSALPTGRMAMFSTYLPFPYEQERQRVLGWFAR